MERVCAALGSLRVAGSPQRGLLHVQRSSRLLRASRMLRRWESRVSLHYATLSWTWAVAKFLLFAHWAACIMVLPTAFQDEPASTWLGVLQYCVSEPAAMTAAVEAAYAATPLSIVFVKRA